MLRRKTDDLPAASIDGDTTSLHGPASTKLYCYAQPALRRRTQLES